MFRPQLARAGIALGAAFGSGYGLAARTQSSGSETSRVYASSSEPGSPISFLPSASSTAACSGKVGKGEISTHVISKLGKGSVDGAAVKVYHNPKFSADWTSSGWVHQKTAALSPNGGIDDLVPEGTLQKGLYLIEFDFSGVDDAARQIFRKEKSGAYSPLNPNGFFLAAKSTLCLKVEDDNSNNHLVLSVGDKELVARPGVRAH